MPKRVRPAKHYQNPRGSMRLLMVAGKRALARDLKQSFDHLSDLVPDEKVKQLIQAGLFHQITGAINFNQYREILKRPFARAAKVYEQAALLGQRKINGTFHAHGRRVRYRKYEWRAYWRELIIKDIDIFAFDRFTPEVQRSLREAQDLLIVGLEQDARDVIERIVLGGQLQGYSADMIVDDIKAMIGLTDTQYAAVANYRSMLESLDTTALSRQLRNTAFDELFRDAVASDEELAAAQVDTMVEDYIENYLSYRASTIAQTESVRAANLGLQDAYLQAIDRGAFPSDAVHREWELGDTPCPICESIPDLNPDGVGVDEPFESSDGPQDNPPVHPNCMCSVNYITDISKVPEDEDESGSFDTEAAREGVG